MIVFQGVTELKEKNIGIDILRIVAMYMIIILHLLGNGGVLSHFPIGSLNYYLIWVLEITCYCAVNCYAIVSGYVGCSGKVRLSRLAYLYLQAMFYLALTAIVFRLLGVGNFGISSFVQILFPFTVKQYWYFTAYFCLFIFMPLLNLVTEKINKKQFRWIIISLFVLFSIMPMIFNRDLFYTGNGYSPVWLAYMYLVGVYIKKYNVRLQKKWMAIGYFLCVLLTYLLKLAIENVTLHIWGVVRGELLFINYTSPFMVLAAVCLVVLFSQICKEKKRIAVKLGEIGKFTFGVYLIHTAPSIWNLYSNRIGDMLVYNPYINVLLIVAAAIVIFVVCVFVDYLRKRLFQLLRVDEFCRKADCVFEKNVGNW